MLNYVRNCNRFMLLRLITLSLLVFLLLRFDIVRGLDDIALEENLEKGLLDGRTILVKDLMSDVELLCVLPPYSSSESIGDFLSEKQRLYLDNRVNSFIGLGDHVWWMVAINGNEDIQVYRMKGVARPSFKAGKCLPQAVSVIRYGSNDGYLFFDFENSQ